MHSANHIHPLNISKKHVVTELEIVAAGRTIKMMQEKYSTTTITMQEDYRLVYVVIGLTITMHVGQPLMTR